MSDKDFDEQKFSWFRTKLDGTVYKNRIYGVYGRKYAFDEIRRMQTGFVIMNANGTFSKQFDVDVVELDERIFVTVMGGRVPLDQDG